MRKCILFQVLLFFLSFPFPLGAMTLDANSVPDNWGDNNLYPYAYNFASNSYHPLDDMGLKYWRDNANVPPEYYAGYRPIIMTGHPTLWGGAYSSYIRLEPSADLQCAWVHDPEDAVLSWDVQASGSYRLQGEFLLAGDDPSNSLYSGSDGINYYIKRNNDVLVSGYLGIGQSASFDETVALIDTDWLHFGVNAYGNDYYDWGHLKGSIDPLNPVPLPCTMLLLGSGLAGVAGMRRRVKR